MLEDGTNGSLKRQNQDFSKTDIQRRSFGMKRKRLDPLYVKAKEPVYRFDSYSNLMIFSCANILF